MMLKIRMLSTTAQPQPISAMAGRILYISHDNTLNMHMDDNSDTDTLIALVISLLPNGSQSFAQDVVIDALVLANGDAETAARTLISSASTTSTRELSGNELSNKRKPVDLDTWLKPPSRKRKLDPVAGPSRSPKFPQHDSNLDNSKPTVDLMSVLRQPPSPKKENTQSRLLPMLLGTPELVAQHTPCTLHLSILPPELSCGLFYAMIEASKTWKRNKWWLFDRVVESPHLTSFFARKTDGLDDDESWQEAAQYWYNGRMTEPPTTFPPEMEEACKIIENIVDEQMRKRKTTFSLEWAGKGKDPLWRANVAASNCYQGGKESVGFHSDHLTYLGPYPTIASLSLGTRRTFSLREVIPTDQIGTRKAQTFNIPLPHNSLIIMHASCQERFKHSIPPQAAIDLFRPSFPPGGADSEIEPSNCRINITFRFYRPDFRPPSIPRCLCGVPTILRPDMKNRSMDETDRYWWTCYAGAQNDGKGCKFWKVMNMREEGRGVLSPSPRLPSS